jgi:small subunit ribosomal protein S6
VRKYEIVFIIRPTLTEDDVKKLVTSFEEVIKSNGANLLKTENMGQKELAYEIEKCKSGFYYLFELEASDNRATKEFERLARNNKDVIRYLTTKVEK